MEELGEAEVVAACAEGLELDCADGGTHRSVDAALLRHCCDGLKDRIDRHRLRLRNAAITGSLDLSGLDVRFQLRFENCEFDSPLVVEGRWALPRRALDVVYSMTVSYGYRPGRVLWLLDILLILVTGSLLIPGTQAAMRATSSGTTYTTKGALRTPRVTSPAPDSTAAATPQVQHRCLRQWSDPSLRPAPLRHRHRHPARIARSKIHVAP
jgi:hypothetical protein